MMLYSSFSGINICKTKISAGITHVHCTASNKISAGITYVHCTASNIKSKEFPVILEGRLKMSTAAKIM